MVPTLVVAEQTGLQFGVSDRPRSNCYLRAFKGTEGAQPFEPVELEGWSFVSVTEEDLDSHGRRSLISFKPPLQPQEQ